MALIKLSDYGDESGQYGTSGGAPISNPPAPSPDPAPTPAPAPQPSPFPSGGDGYDDNAHNRIKQPSSGDTISPGRSTTPQQANDYTHAALSAGVPQSFINSFLASNPGDYNRLISAFDSGHTGAGQDTSITGGAWVPNPNDPRAAISRPSGYAAPGTNYPGFQFNDPYTNLLEQIAKNQINSLTGNNPQMTQLMDFLNQQFGKLSTSNGYTPDELAVLNTQALEPIEAMRKASQQRELQRTSMAGYLPTSGITLDQQRQIDTDADKARTAANRDLAINGINRQDQQRQQAVNIGLQALQLPQQQNAQALDVAGLLYNLPRQAMMDAETVINGSSPQSVISPYIQLLAQQQQAALQQQQQQAAWAESIGRILAGMFG